MPSSCALWGGFAIGVRVLLHDNIHVYVSKLIALYTANAYSDECEMSASACTRSMAGLYWKRCKKSGDKCWLLPAVQKILTNHATLRVTANVLQTKLSEIILRRSN